METTKNTENALNEVVKRALEVAEKTGEFVIEQAPDLLKEFYTWHTYMHIFWVVLSFFVVLLLFGKVKSSLKRITGYDEEFQDDLFSIIGGAAIICFTIVFFVNLYELIFIISAPKLYLIEYFVK